MNGLARSLAAAAAGTALLGVVGCASQHTAAAPDPNPGQPADSPAHRPASVAEFDPCTAMTPQQLSFGRFPAAGSAVDMSPQEHGCQFVGSSTTLTFSKNTTRTLESYQSTGEFTPVEVNGRTAATVRATGDSRDQCSTVLPARDGVVAVSVRATDPAQGFDGCAESLKWAKQAEPNLPL